MSQLAQAVERAVQEMRAKAQQKQQAAREQVKRQRTRRADMDFDESDGTATATAEPPSEETSETAPGQDALDSLADGQPAAAGGETDMANGMATAGRRRKVSGAVVGAGKRRLGRGRAGKRGKRRPPAEGGRALKTYRLVGGLPDQPAEGTHGRAILEVIKAKGRPTLPEIRDGLPRKVSPLTVRKYLQMFKTAKVIAAS